MSRIKARERIAALARERDDAQRGRTFWHVEYQRAYGRFMAAQGWTFWWRCYARRARVTHLRRMRALLTRVNALEALDLDRQARIRQLMLENDRLQDETARWQKHVANALRAYHEIESDKHGRCRGCGAREESGVPCGVGCPLRALLDALVTDVGGE